MLSAGQGHQLYWEESGNPHGIAALYLHGGPGAPLRPGYRRNFDPERYRLISLQQRGAGRSTPLVGDFTGGSTPAGAAVTGPSCPR